MCSQLKADGTYGKDNAKAYIDASKMPDEVKEKMKKVVDECFEEGKEIIHYLIGTYYDWYKLLFDWYYHFFVKWRKK